MPDTRSMAAEGIRGTVGGGLCPLPLRWAAPGAGGPPRVRTPPLSGAGQLAVTHPGRLSRAVSRRKRAELAATAERPGALPRTPALPQR